MKCGIQHKDKVKYNIGSYERWGCALDGHDEYANRCEDRVIPNDAEHKNIPRKGKAEAVFAG
eukprot:14577772-Ditylum_brightwellii.AAC.1